MPGAQLERRDIWRNSDIAPAVPGFHLRHDRERPAFIVVEEIHPLFGSIGMFVNHVRRVGEGDAAGAQFFIRGVNVRDAEIEDRGAVAAIALREKEAHAAAIEKSEISECEKVGKAELFLVKEFRRLDVLDRAGDLPDRTQFEIFHRLLPFVKRARFRDAVPAAQGALVVETKFQERIGDMEFDGVLADAKLARDPLVGHSVADKFANPPFGRRQNVVMRRSSAAITHDADPSAKRGQFPYPRRQALTPSATPHSFAAMSQTLSLFATRIHRAAFSKSGALNEDIVAAALSFAEDDGLGRRWSEDNAYPGYTSYGSLTDLPTRASCFAALKKLLDAEAAKFARVVHFDLGGGKLKLDNLWINILDPGGFHSGHIHPHSIISGTYYAQVPDGAASLKFEDPRLPMMMAAPTRTEDAPQDLRNFVYLAPEPGMMLMWESWLRHEVVLNDSEDPRISVSFNYRWE